MTQREDLANVLHELQTHQAELEAQNRELRESREALEASRARYTDLFDFAPVGYMAMDPSGAILEINLTGAALLGYERGRIDGKPLRVLVRLDESDAMHEHRHRCLSQRTRVESEFGFVRKSDEAHVWVQAVSVPVLGPGGEATACRTALVDITERKKVERQLEQALEREREARRALERARAEAEEANRLKDEFLSIASHELRTPLNAILGWAHLLSTDAAAASASGGKLRRGLEVIRRNAEAQKRLVEDLLDLQRIAAGKLRVELAPLQLETLVRGAVESMQPAAETKHVDLALDLRAAPSVMADGARLHQAVWNLLSNAIKFTPPGGRVTVEVDAHDDRALIRVNDTGVGIEAEALRWIFERFRQGDTSASRSHGGLGLGLAIVRHIVELHGGRVRGESAGPGRGATFVIELPVAGENADAALGARRRRAQAAGPDDQPTAREPRLRGVRVLVVDDDDDGRHFAAEVLEREGAVVEVGDSAQAAVDRIMARAPDVLVSDLAMPGEDGLSLMARVRDLPSPLGRLPAIALTAHARSEDAVAARRAGYDAYLAKPVDVDILVETVARVARAAR